MRISDWSSECALPSSGRAKAAPAGTAPVIARQASSGRKSRVFKGFFHILRWRDGLPPDIRNRDPEAKPLPGAAGWDVRPAGATARRAIAGARPPRSEERRVGKEWIRPGRTRGW